MSISIISSNALLSAIANEFYCTIPELLLNTKLKKILKLTNTTMNVVDNLSNILNKSKFDIEFIHNGIQKNKAKVNNLERIFPLSGIFSNSKWRDNIIIFLVCIDAWGIDITADCLFRYTDMEGINLYDYTYCNNSDLALDIIKVKNMEGNVKLVDDSYQFRMQSINVLYRKYKDIERYLYITGFERNPRSWTILKDTYDFWENKILESNTDNTEKTAQTHTYNKSLHIADREKTSQTHACTKSLLTDDRGKTSQTPTYNKSLHTDDREKTSQIPTYNKSLSADDREKTSQITTYNKSTYKDDKSRQTKSYVSLQTTSRQTRSKTAQHKSTYDDQLARPNTAQHKSTYDDQSLRPSTSQNKSTHDDHQSLRPYTAQHKSTYDDQSLRLSTSQHKSIHDDDHQSLRPDTAQHKSTYDDHQSLRPSTSQHKSTHDDQSLRPKTAQQRSTYDDQSLKNSVIQPIISNTLQQKMRSISVSRTSDDTSFQRGLEYKNEGCYLIQEAIDRQLNNDVYKIGRSDHIKRRMTTSAEYTNATIIVTMCVKDSVACETEIKKEFGRHFVLAEENIDGSKNKERYKGSLDLMRLLFIHICLKYV